ncbi:MAG: hypothetical protein FWG42_05475 [Clostridiales bacterium]|nr:hypothetical protein [Clostridiales bacterium]
MMTQDRVKTLIEVLCSDQERSEKLVGLGSSEAWEQINILGYDFTLDEIQEFGMLVREAQKSFAIDEELCLEALDEVAGGRESFGVNLWAANFSVNW